MAQPSSAADHKASIDLAYKLAKSQEVSIKALREKAHNEASRYKDFVHQKSAQAQTLIANPSQQRCPISNTLLESNSPHPKRQTQPLIFVSSSMPIASLKQLALEAKQVGARLVIRGMVKNSMTETALLVKELNFPLDIDPKLFQKHAISHVPVFLIPVKESQSWHSLRGNISLIEALDRSQKTPIGGA